MRRASILRVRQPDTDDAGNPIPGAITTTEVTKIEFGEQPAALFAFAPPDGVAAMPLEAYDALCRPGRTRCVPRLSALFGNAAGCRSHPDA